MPPRTPASDILRDARQRAGLTQRALAAKAGTSQSVVARIEGGVASPSVETLVRLLAAAGFEFDLELRRKPVLDRQLLDDVARILSLTAEQRLEEVANVSRFISAARRV
jgi:transcriptional regulator with XRE-family HTH domain